MIQLKNTKLENVDCEDPIEGLRKMFIDRVQKGRVKAGQCPVRRPVFLKTHGSIKCEITFDENIPDVLQQGIFSHVGKSFQTYLHYTSDTRVSSPDLKTTIGLGIKIFGMPGEKVVSDDGADTADIILQNSPNFFVDNAKDMCSFTSASLQGKGDKWIRENSPRTGEILEEMQKKEASVLEAKLWSVVPFKLGENHCKYILLPGKTTPGKDPNFDDPNYLKEDLIYRVGTGASTLDLYIQMRPSEASEDFPLDKAMTIWDEEEAKPIKVATILLPQQDITGDERQRYGDWLGFNIGRVPAENAPVGSISEARVKIYQVSAEYRKKMNQQPTTEPSKIDQPKIEDPVCRSLSKDQIKRITTVKIHPGIGIGRVGNSEEFYIGPEEINPPLTEFGGTRDENGAIKREAARFRVYGYDSSGKLVGEIQNSLNSSIKWSVHLANKKAAWFEFIAAMDIPSMKNTTVNLRNPSVRGAKRKKLVIDGGETYITGTDTSGDAYKMVGKFDETSVYIGELQTDEAGRLLVLPGMGKSGSPSNQPPYDPNVSHSFSNARDWYDDVADGPVRATVNVAGREIEAVSAWFASAPPNFAPNIISWRTMNDLMRHLFMKSGQISLPNPIVFNHHVKPILQRMSNLQWVNKGFSAMFGVDGPMNFDDSDLVAKLSSVVGKENGDDIYKELRRSILNSFRTNTSTSLEKYAWPGIYGDEFGEVEQYENSPKYYFNLPPVYRYILREWVDGNFVTDAEITMEEPDILDQSAMHFCIADAFHPGAELTWPMRHVSMYDAPYRIKTRDRNQPEPNYGGRLSSAAALQIGGPLYEQGPGDLTKWMALPWQGDTAYCRSGYESSFDPYVPTYWPARVPNQVFALKDYNTLCDTDKTKEERLAALHNREAWMRTVPQTLPAPEQMKYMVAHFEKMGIVEAKPRPEDMPWLPEVLFVENLQDVPLKGVLLSAEEEALQLEQNKVLAKTGWLNDEQREEMFRIRRRK
ncbi:MAG: LodA/GoxA family CTQ-dependent oxidase [Chitinophagales bacterium]